MSLSPPDPPVTEYEQQLERRRRRARKLVAIGYGITCVPYVASWFVGLLWWFVGLQGSGSQAWPFCVAFGMAWTCGVATGIVTLCHWPLLTWRDRAFGLAPWFYFALLSLPFVVNLLR